MPSTGDLAQNPDMCPDWESNQQPFGSQASAQSTEPHQPGQNVLINLLMREKTQRCVPYAGKIRFPHTRSLKKDVICIKICDASSEINPGFLQLKDLAV